MPGRGLAAIGVVFAATAVQISAQEAASAPKPPATEATGEPPKAPATDWAKEVERACTSPRYGLRLAAARKVGSAGDEAVAAVRAFAKARGNDALPSALVDAYADLGGNGHEVVDLLTQWSIDREFYWRAAALRGLALRCTDDGMAAQLATQFAPFVDDPAWLVRVYAREGARRVATRTSGSGSPPRWSPETDPRALVRAAALADDPVPLVQALGDERTFLGDPWGRRRAGEAFTALQKLAGEGFGYTVGAPFAENAPAILRALEHFAPGKGLAPEQFVDPSLQFAGALEVLSCRNGDLFVHWTADGVVLWGTSPDCPRRVDVGAERWRKLSESAAALDLEAQSGVVICDRIRLQSRPDAAQAGIAPRSMPPVATEWLKQLAATIEESGEPELAGALRDRLQQFAAR